MNDCLFCKIIERKLPSKIVFEDENLVAFEDVNPQAPVHILLVPRRHIESVNGVEEIDRELMGHLFWISRKLAQERGVAASGYRLVVNSGASAGQSVFHIHVHLVGGRAFGWPPG